MRHRQSGRRRSHRTLEPLERRLLLYDVTNTNDSGPGSLRQAFLDVNANSDGQKIYMNIPGGTEAQPKRIELLSPLPVLTKGTNLRNTNTVPARSVVITTAPSVRGTFDGIVSTAGLSVSRQVITGFRHGLVISGGTGQIGLGDLDDRNAIFGNSGDGVRFIGTGAGSVTMTDLYDNGGMAIDNGGDGPNPNDPGDADDGNNWLLNSPTLLSARIEEDKITVRFSTSSLPSGWGYESDIDFFLGSSSAVGQGGRFVFTSALGYSQDPVFSFPIPALMPANPIISSSFTQTGNTSELSSPVPLEGLPIYVTSNADAGPGSFREAIALANSKAGFDNIRFALPAGQRQINLLAALPQITGAVLIDGTSTAEYPEDRVRINGSAAPADSDGLVIASAEPCTIRGMGVTGFRHGIVIGAGNGHVIGNRISWGGSYSAWNYIYRNRGDGIRVTAGSDHNLRYNSLTFNGGLAIDLGGDGADVVDVGDVDTGPNGRVNAPILTHANYYQNRFTANATLRGQAGVTYAIDLWAVPPTDTGAGIPEAKHMGTLFATPNDTADKYLTDSDMLYNQTLVGWNVYSMASLGNTGGTSETSSVSIWPSPKFYVSSTADSGPATLRQALLDANAASGLNTVTFVLATGAVIQLDSPLPPITDPVQFSGSSALTPAPALLGTIDGLVLASSGSTIGSSSLYGFRHGMVIRGSSNQIQANRVYANTGDGIRIESGTANNIASSNAIYGNAGLSIDLGGDGATANDALDVDTGANELQNAPQLLTASTDYLQSRVTGRLDAKPNTVYRIDLFYGAPGAGPEMSQSMPSFTLTTDAGGAATFDRIATGTNRPVPGNVVSATATDPAGNTSEVAAQLAVSAPSLLVTNTSSSGAGSLYDALGNANFYPGLDTISFNLPGPGPYRIAASVALPQITGGVLLDGTTQPGYAGAPQIELMGLGYVGSEVVGLNVAKGAGSVIRGLAIGGFNVGIYIATTDVRVEGCYVGLDASGAAAPNRIGIMTVGERGTIGGTVAAARNVVSANAVSGVDLSGKDNLALGNFIGTNPAGSAAMGNQTGVQVSGINNVLGGTAAGARNVVSGNLGSGVSLGVTTASGSAVVPMQYNRVVGNSIGLSASGTALGNGADGVQITARGTFVGGAAAGEGNVIAFNQGAGVRVFVDSTKTSSGVQNAIRGNAIHANTGLGIDLLGDGVTGNDFRDADAGPNDLQNYPVISFVGSDGAATRITGSVHSTPIVPLTLDFYAAPADGSGQTYFGSTPVNTDGAGNGSFAASFAMAVPPGQLITATATSPTGSTSEFSASQWVPIPGDTNRDGVVNFFDLTAMAASYGRTDAAWADGDINGDGAVNFFDMTALAANYSATLPSPALPVASEAEVVTPEAGVVEAPAQIAIEASAPTGSASDGMTVMTKMEAVSAAVNVDATADAVISVPAPTVTPPPALAAAKTRKRAPRTIDDRPLFAVTPAIKPVPRVGAHSFRRIR